MRQCFRKGRTNMFDRLLQKKELKRNAAIAQENKAGKAPNFYHRQNYAWYREHLKIDAKMILLEGFRGRALEDCKAVH